MTFYHAIASIALLAGVGALLVARARTMLTAKVLCTAQSWLRRRPSTRATCGRCIPYLLPALVLGVSAAARFLAQRVKWLPSSPLPSVGVLVLLAIAALWREVRLPAPEAIDHQPEARALHAWLRERHPRTPMRVLYSNPRVLTLETRVPAMAALIVPPSKQLQAMSEERITHLVWQPVMQTDCRARLANALPTEFPDRFALEYSNSKWRVYRLLQPTKPEPASEGSTSRWPTYRCSMLFNEPDELRR